MVRPALFAVLFLCKITREVFSYEIPDPIFQAYSPKGFSISLPDSPGVKFVAFHARRNTPLNDAEPGEFTGEVTSPEKGVWAYHNTESELEKGDTIYYWIFVQHEQFGYKKGGLQFTVNDVRISPCKVSQTHVEHQTICSGDIIFKDEFSQNRINISKWTIDHMIPVNSKDFEFVSYQNNGEVVYTKNGSLFIKPKALTSEERVRGTLDLKQGCTGTGNECFYQHQFYQILPPVVSARLRSKIKFKFGKIVIKAKLPQGDWTFPQIRLKSSEDVDEEVWIAYSRGNRNLVGDSGDDLGATLLFGGLVQNKSEPQRSRLLRSKKSEDAFSDESRVYVLLWGTDGFQFYVDGVRYGTILYDELQNPEKFKNELYLIIGLGVGGINDFPDGYKSDGHQKPWTNSDPKQKKMFFQKRDTWLPTWVGENSALQVDSIKIFAL